MQILLVEDNEMVAKGLLYTLKQSGYEPIHKANIKDTKAFLQNENNKAKLNLVILDISLPDGDGFTLYEEDLKDKNIPTIFLTAKDEEDEDVFVIEGPRIEKMLGYTNLESEKGFLFFQNFMKENGILEQLEELGIKDGDTVRIYGHEFEYYK